MDDGRRVIGVSQLDAWNLEFSLREVVSLQRVIDKLAADDNLHRPTGCLGSSMVEQLTLNLKRHFYPLRHTSPDRINIGFF